MKALQFQIKANMTYANCTGYYIKTADESTANVYSTNMFRQCGSINNNLLSDENDIIMKNIYIVMFYFLYY